jgi:predicted nucleotidyltransferase
MRLSPYQVELLRTRVRRRFGASARVWVFGSRVDDTARGGDYDFMVRCEDLDAHALVDARLRLLADLHDDPAFEDERIDIVLYSTRLDPQPRPIHRAALEQGVEIGAGS